VGVVQAGWTWIACAPGLEWGAPHTARTNLPARHSCRVPCIDQEGSIHHHGLDISKTPQALGMVDISPMGMGPTS
jgi:hypothetical protein